jgi:tRNA(Ile)-lysidine synthase
MLPIVRRAWESLSPQTTTLPGLVVAVSGGPDSIALLRALIGVRGEQPVPLVVAHLNHQLRGAESDVDETFVAELHERLTSQGIADLHCVRHKIDLPRIREEQGGNLEAVARRERYRWLAEVARKAGLHHVATGHTASDQAETVLHHLVRGTGLSGLRGIAFRRELEPGISVVRPLLSITREQVLDFLRERNQAARHDASNDDPGFTRNRIRHELLPLLAHDYNPRIIEALARLAAQVEEVFAEEEPAAEELLCRAERPRAGALVILDVGRLRQSPPRLVRAALRRVWQREGWPMGEMGFEHWQRLADLVAAEDGAHDLPGGARARRRGNVLQLQGPSAISEREG